MLPRRRKSKAIDWIEIKLLCYTYLDSIVELYIDESSFFFGFHGIFEWKLAKSGRVGEIVDRQLESASQWFGETVSSRQLSRSTYSRVFIDTSHVHELMFNMIISPHESTPPPRHVPAPPNPRSGGEEGGQRSLPCGWIKYFRHKFNVQTKTKT